SSRTGAAAAAASGPAPTSAARCVAISPGRRTSSAPVTGTDAPAASTAPAILYAPGGGAASVPSIIRSYPGRMIAGPSTASATTFALASDSATAAFADTA